ncbi:MAG: hypothetical protein NTW87_24200, partial [Planctomycetota bacterium]|nr:hypothetical protein [Planctomycetota bacterium]
MAEQTPECKARRAKFLEEAGADFDRMMKEDQEQMITFDQMEDRALEVGGKLQRWLVEQCLAKAARRKLCRAMGFTHKRSPCISTFHYLFKDLDAAVVERILQEWLQAHHP